MGPVIIICQNEFVFVGEGYEKGELQAIVTVIVLYLYYVID